MSYTLATLWFDRRRYVPAMMAVAFSALLVALQCGLLLGTFSIVSIPIDHAAAEVWVGGPEVLSIDVGRAIPTTWQARLSCPEIAQTEAYVQSFASWRKPSGAMEMVIVTGSRLQPDALGKVMALTPDLCSRLNEPNAVVVDQADLGRLAIPGVGAQVEINGQRVRVVGLVNGLKGLAGPYVFGSLQTARTLLRMSEDQATYLLARCRQPGDAAVVAQRLAQRHPHEMTVMTRDQFSFRSRWHWLVSTGAGIALLCAAVLGLLVGAVITSQTLYAATAASMREFAVLRAMGTPRWRISSSVLLQSLCVGVIGVAIAGPAVFTLTRLAHLLGAQTALPGWLLGSTVILTLSMAMLSGLWALRSLRLMEPATLLR
jgi:putative ABC transport system permease protein